MPTNISARPTTDFARENIFNVLENMVDFDGLKALDLFAGTGAITFEFLSRGCAEVTSVEKAATQYKFIKQVAQQLNCKNLNLIKGDAFKFIESCSTKFDIIFADPPYDLEGTDELPDIIMQRGLLKPEGIFVFEHSKHKDFTDHPYFTRHRSYGSVNFSIFEPHVAADGRQDK